MSAPAGDGVRRTVRTIDTPQGPARAHLHTPTGAEPAGALVLSHGAGGRNWSKDLLALATLAGGAAAEPAATDAADAARPWQVVLVEQPWRVAGRSVAPAPAKLDEAWLAVLAALRAGPAHDGEIAGPLVVGGRSAGARVACRTAQSVGAPGVLALAFPLHPPGRPAASRAAELAGVRVPVLVVQGASDPFGTPEEVRAAVPGVPVVAVRGGHGFTADVGPVLATARDWLEQRSGE